MVFNYNKCFSYSSFPHKPKLPCSISYGFCYLNFCVYLSELPKLIVILLRVYVVSNLDAHDIIHELNHFADGWWLLDFFVFSVTSSNLHSWVFPCDWPTHISTLASPKWESLSPSLFPECLPHPSRNLFLLLLLLFLATSYFLSSEDVCCLKPQWSPLPMHWRPRVQHSSWWSNPCPLL